MPHIQLPSIRLYYEEHGAGDPMLLIHGTSTSAMMWAAAIPQLERLGRVIAYDRRGCTRSERPQPYATTRVSDHADDAAELLAALADRPAIVIGRSYGGGVAIDLALRYPERVRALALLEPAVASLSPEARQWETEMVAMISRTAEEAGIDAVAEAFLRDVLGDAAWEQFPPPAKQMFTANSPAILAEILGGTLQVDRAALATIAQPTLLVAAAESRPAFRQITDALAAALPNARSALIEGGHLISPADPAVLEFVAGIIAADERERAAAG